MPELLVSVRNASEAINALQGGCGIVDIKEPKNGPLGMANVDGIAEIARQCRQFPNHPVSVALGDVDEWPADRPSPSLLDRFDYLKIGPGTLEQPDEWIRRLTDIQQRFVDSAVTRPRWIAAIYADRPLATNVIGSHIALLRNAGYFGLMVDTAEKTGQSLLDAMSTSELRTLIESCHESGIVIGLAGSLSLVAMESLLGEGICPDLFGVRSAACADHNRSGSVKRALVQQLHNALLAHT